MTDSICNLGRDQRKQRKVAVELVRRRGNKRWCLVVKVDDVMGVWYWG